MTRQRRRSKQPSGQLPNPERASLPDPLPSCVLLSARSLPKCGSKQRSTRDRALARAPPAGVRPVAGARTAAAGLYRERHPEGGAVQAPHPRGVRSRASHRGRGALSSPLRARFRPRARPSARACRRDRGASRSRPRACRRGRGSLASRPRPGACRRSRGSLPSRSRARSRPRACRRGRGARSSLSRARSRPGACRRSRVALSSHPLRDTERGGDCHADRCLPGGLPSSAFSRNLRGGFPGAVSEGFPGASSGVHAGRVDGPVIP